MKPMAFNLKNAKKVAGDQHSSTFEMNGGHQIRVAHHAVSALHRKQLEKMPVHKYADGGDVLSINTDQPKIDESLINPEPGALAQMNGVRDHDATYDPENIPYGMTPESIQALKNPTPERVPSSQAMPIPGDGMPQSQQAPALPTQSGDVAGGYAQGLKGIQEQQDVASKQAKAQEAIQAKDIADRQKIAQDTQMAHAAIQEQRGHYVKDLENENINPNHYVENMSTPQKVATAIGLLLGGFTAGYSKDGVNPASEWLNKQIDRDIDGQKMRIGKQKTLLEANQQMFHDNILAENQTRLNLNDTYDRQIQLAAAKLGTPAAKAAADQQSAKFKLDNASLMQQSALRAAALNGAANGQLDPAKLVPILVPKEHQAKAFEEIKSAEDIKKLTPQIMAAFEKGSSRNPIEAAQGQREFEGLINTTVKETEGTVRQAAMDSIHKTMTPSGLFAGPGENEVKKDTVAKYLQSKSSAPFARGFGIDLGKYNSTSPPPLPQGKSESVQRIDPKSGKIALFDPNSKKFLGYK